MQQIRHRSAGFTLIEAMVAMVIIAGAGMALFTWVNASIVALRRVEDANVRNSASANAIEYMQSVNPMLRPEGEVDLGTYTLAWTAKPRMSAVDGSGYPFGLSEFELALYDTDIKAVRKDGGFWFDLKMTLVGYKKVRSFKLPGQP